MFREPTSKDFNHLLDLSEKTGVFKPGEVEALLGGTLKEFEEKKLGEGHEVFTLVDEKTDSPKGWVYFSPSFKAEGVWDLWWIGVHPDHQKEGVGGKLLKFVEEKVKKAGGRVLIIETSTAVRKSMDQVAAQQKTDKLLLNMSLLDIRALGQILRLASGQAERAIRYAACQVH